MQSTSIKKSSKLLFFTFIFFFTTEYLYTSTPFSSVSTTLSQTNSTLGIGLNQQLLSNNFQHTNWPFISEGLTQNNNPYSSTFFFTKKLKWKYQKT